MKKRAAYRRAWALACHTRMRAGFPRPATIAGDRPPRYGPRRVSVYRRARACPSPCSDRGGQAPALRAKGVSADRRAWALGCHTRMRAGFPRHATIAGDRPPRYGPKGFQSRGTGPRATGRFVQSRLTVPPVPQYQRLIARHPRQQVQATSVHERCLTSHQCQRHTPPRHPRRCRRRWR